MVDNLKGLDTFDFGYAAAKRECAAELSTANATVEELHTKLAEQQACITAIVRTIENERGAKYSSINHATKNILAIAQGTGSIELTDLLSAEHKKVWNEFADTEAVGEFVKDATGVWCELRTGSIRPDKHYFIQRPERK
jgi:hypothetical protein